MESILSHYINKSLMYRLPLYLEDCGSFTRYFIFHGNELKKMTWVSNLQTCNYGMGKLRSLCNFTLLYYMACMLLCLLLEIFDWVI